MGTLRFSTLRLFCICYHVGHGSFSLAETLLIKPAECCLSQNQGKGDMLTTVSLHTLAHIVINHRLSGLLTRQYSQLS